MPAIPATSDNVSLGISVQSAAIGALGDGTTDDAPAFALVASTIPAGVRVIVPNGTYRLASDVTLPHTLQFDVAASLLPDLGVTVTLEGGIEAGLHPLFAGAGDVVLTPGGVAEAYPQWWGATGDGTTDDAAAFAKAPAVTVPAGTYRFAADATLANHLRFEPGAVLAPDTGVTVTLEGGMDAGLFQVFDGAGTVVPASDFGVEPVPQWWGARGDGATDCSAAFAAAPDMAVPAGSYRFASNVVLPQTLRFAPDAVLEPDGGVLLTLEGRVEAGPHRIFGGVGTIVLRPRAFVEAYPHWWGALGDIDTDDAAAFAAASVPLTLPPGLYRIASNLTIAQPLRFHPSAALLPDSGVTVTLAGGVDAGLRPIVVGDGVVTVAPGSVARAYPQWWGAAGDGSTDDGPALALAQGVTLTVPAGTYRVGADQALTSRLELQPGAVLAPDTGVTLTLGGGIGAGPYPVFGGAGTVALADGGVAEAYPQWWGAEGDGTADDVAAFSNASAVTIPAGTYRFAANVTLPHNLRFEPGAVLAPDTGVTVTLSGGVQAPLLPIFGGAGTVVVSGSAVAEVYPQWWGAAGDGSHDDAPAIQRAVDALAAAGGGTLFFPPGTYLVNTPQFDAASQTGYAVQVRGDNISLVGAGTRSVLQAGAAMISATTAPQSGYGAPYIVEYRGDVVNSDHRNAVKNGTVRTLSFLGNGVAANSANGIHAAPYSERISVTDCHGQSLGQYGFIDHSSSYKAVQARNIAVSCAVAFELSGTLVTHSALISENLAINCQESYSVQFGEACSIVGNVAFYDQSFVAGMGNYAIRVSGQRGTVVSSNVVDARNAPAGQTLGAGIVLGLEDPVVSGAYFGYPAQVKVVGNHVVGRVDRGIKLIGGLRNVVANNTVGDTSTSIPQVAVGIELTVNGATSQRSQYNLVQGNIVSVDGTTGYGIRETSGGGDGNTIVENDIARCGSGLAVTTSATASPASRVAHNRGFVSEASGTVTIANGAQSVTINLSTLFGFGANIDYSMVTLQICGTSGAAYNVVAANLTNTGSHRFDAVLNAVNATGSAITVAYQVAKP